MFLNNYCMHLDKMTTISYVITVCSLNWHLFSKDQSLLVKAHHRFSLKGAGMESCMEWSTGIPWKHTSQLIDQDSGMSGPPLTGNAIEDTITKVPRPKPFLNLPNHKTISVTALLLTGHWIFLFIYLMKKCTLKEDNLKMILIRVSNKVKKRNIWGFYLFIYWLIF